MMGCVEGISHEAFPRQSEHVGNAARVTFDYDLKRTLRGTIVRDDREAPWQTIILLDDGRYVRGVECQYAPWDTNASELEDALAVALLRETQAKAAEIERLKALLDMNANLNAKLITDMGRVGLENDALCAKWASVPWKELTVAVEYSLVEEYFASPDVALSVEIAKAWLNANDPQTDKQRYEVTTITEDVGL